MTASELVISPAARDDLKDIYQYGCRNRGLVRSSRYIEYIKRQLWLLTENPEMGVKREEVRAGVRSVVVASHVIFYRTHSSRLEVIRVLHGRQDYQQKLMR